MEKIVRVMEKKIGKRLPDSETRNDTGRDEAEPKKQLLMSVNTCENFNQNLQEENRERGDDEPLHTRRDVKVEAKPIALYAGARTHKRSLRRPGIAVKVLPYRSLKLDENALIELLSRKIEQRSSQHAKHEDAEKIACSQGPHDLRPKRKQIRPPRQAKHHCHPVRHARRNLRILQKIDHNSQQAKHTACRNETARIQRSGTRLTVVLLFRRSVYQHPQQPTHKHRRCRPQRQV